MSHAHPYQQGDLYFFLDINKYCQMTFLNDPSTYIFQGFPRYILKNFICFETYGGKKLNGVHFILFSPMQLQTKSNK